MIGQNVQLLDIFCYLGGFLCNTERIEQTKTLVKAKRHQARCIIVP